MKTLIGGGEEAEILSRMNILRGVFAVLILLGHCARRFELEPSWLVIPHYGNFIWVCYFFCVSGWGLSFNYDIKENYLKGFIKRKIVKLAILALETEVIVRGLKLLILQENPRLDMNLLLGWNWYIYELIVLYMCFWLIYRTKLRLVEKQITLWICTIILAIFFWELYRHGTWSGWTFAFYYSIFSFPLGVTIHFMFEKFFAINRPLLIILVCVMSIGSTICILMPKDSFVGGVVLHNCLGMGCMSLLIIFLKYVNVNRLIFLRPIIKRSVYIYLYQFGVMSVMSALYKEKGKTIDSMYVLLVVVITFALATGVYYMNFLVNRLIINRKEVRL